MPNPESTTLIQVTTSGGWGGRETLPLAIHKWRLKRGLPSHLVVGADTRLADNVSGVDEVTRSSRGRVAVALSLRRVIRCHPGASTLLCHFTRDLASIRLALMGHTDTPFYVIKHVSPGPPKQDFAHRFLYRRVTGLFAVSEFVREKCTRVYPIAPEKTAVWHPGIDTERFAFDPNLREVLRTKAAVAADTIVAGYVARITPNKGLEDLIDATAQLHPYHPQLRLWIAGSASPDEQAYEHEIHERITRQGVGDIVRFAGWQDNPAGFLSAIDLFVVPSQQESFGLTTIEAMACASPVAGVRAGGTAEIVSEGHTGLLADPHGDVTGNLAAIIRTLITNPERRAEFGRQGRARAEIHFSHQAMMDRLHALTT